VAALLALLPWTPATAQDSTSFLDRYDLSSGEGTRVELPRSLQEVSGLATTSDGRLFAHDDERAIVQEVDPETGAVVKYFFVGRMGVPGDFEGIAVAGDRFFLLTSSGRLAEFREGGHRQTVPYDVHDLGLVRRCEAEGLAFDAGREALLVPCKTIRDDDLEDHLVVFSVPLGTMAPDPTPRIFIPLETLDDNGLGDDFHPSAIEVHPESGAFIILAAREEAGVVVSPDGELLATFEMKRRDHPQPEGIAFLSDGSLVFADEGQGRLGTLTVYRPKAGGPEGGR
jgi:hypothetical protein